MEDGIVALAAIDCISADAAGNNVIILITIDECSPTGVKYCICAAAAMGDMIAGNQRYQIVAFVAKNDTIAGPTDSQFIIALPTLNGTGIVSADGHIDRVIILIAIDGTIKIGERDAVCASASHQIAN